MEKLKVLRKGMFHLNRHVKNERGLTLVELLASIVLLAVISMLVFPIITNTMENNRAIQQETMLRDEADIIVSQFIKALYSTKQTHIVRNTTNGSGDSYIEVTTDLQKCRKNEEGALIDAAACNTTLQPIGFKTKDGVTKLHIRGDVYAIAHPDIKILPSSHIKGNPNSSTLYEINLTLQITHHRGNKKILKEKTFINQIQPILTSN